MAFLRAVAREELVPCFHEVIGGRVWRGADADVQLITGEQAEAILRAVADAPVGEFPFELVERFPDVALPGASELDTDVDLPYAPRAVWRVGGTDALEADIENAMEEARAESPEDRNIWLGYERDLFDCVELCTEHLLVFSRSVSNSRS